MLFIEYHT